jgi:CubicO group peptidase (beta-lactamase class C family)
MQTFHGINVDNLLKIKGKRGYGVSIAVAQGDDIETYCSGSGRFGQDFPVNPDMLFQAGSVSKPMFALTLLRYVDKGLIDLDADISGVLSDFVDFPLTFPALLSHTAGFNVHGFAGYRASHKALTLEDVVLGRGNSPKVKQTKPYGEQFCYSGGGITLAELAFTRLTATTLRDAFEKEVAMPLGLKRSGYFQPLDECLVPNAAFGGMLGIWEDRKHGYHYYPEHAAAGFWTTPTELARIGIAMSRSVREGGLLSQKTAERMITPVLDNIGICVFRDWNIPNLAGHSGWNEGFLTVWGFSLTEDLCVAAMINRSTISTSKKLSEIGDTLFARAREQWCDQAR